MAGPEPASSSDGASQLQAKSRASRGPSYSDAGPGPASSSDGAGVSQLLRYDREDDEGDCEYKYSLASPSAARLQHLITQLLFRLNEGARARGCGGRCVYRLGVLDDGTAAGLGDAELRASLRTLADMARALGAGVSSVTFAAGNAGRVAEVVVEAGRAKSPLADLDDLQWCCRAPAPPVAAADDDDDDAAEMDGETAVTALSVKWFQLAAAQGQPEALYALGCCHARGRGVPEDAAEARRCFARAAAEGHANAAEALERRAAAPEFAPPAS
ncbi:hypothetical protein M885DRAFT_614953 [Pelagophyceae sp. CCMP2097]|nr:hypothetical protein M885DRAFT_614953 [Pelagophyceae sp. CCMP2097]